jgi:hypothetical protein
MLTAITAMMVSMWLTGATVGAAEIIVFSVLDLLAVLSMTVLLRSTVSEPNVGASK